MTENTTDALIGAIQSMARDAVRAELKGYREQLEEVCLQAAEAAIRSYVDSDAFQQSVTRAVGGDSEGLEATIKDVVSREVSRAGESVDVAGAVEQYLSENASTLFRGDAVQIELNSLVLDKAKELFKRSALSGSLDMKKAVTRVVESILEARGITGEGAGGATAGQDLKAAVLEYLRENLGGTLSDTICREVRSYLASEAMKELLDTKFRAIDLYLKTDLIPKVVKREIAKVNEEA